MSTSTPSVSRSRSAIRVARSQQLFDERPDALAPERADRRVQGEASSSPRAVEHPLPVLALLAAHQVRGGHRHRGAVGGRVADRDEPAVVADVQPLVGIGRPGVGAFDAVHEVLQPGRDGGPQPERAVDVEPRVRVTLERRRRSRRRGRSRRCSRCRPGRRRSAAHRRRRWRRAPPRSASGPGRRSRRGSPGHGRGRGTAARSAASRAPPRR